MQDIMALQTPPHAVGYKTGDLACWLQDGNIEFRGRRDRQAKIRGYRIEPAEIEHRLKEHPGVKDVLVLPFRDENREYLCAYVVPSVSTARDETFLQELKAFLVEVLPGYMAPEYFVEVDRIPVNENGKVDVSLLPPLPTHRPVGVSTYIEPRGSIQQVIAETWKEVLGREKIGTRDNIFDLGGNSLDMIKISSKLKEKLDRDIPVMALFTYPTIDLLERYLMEEGETPVSRKDIEERQDLIDEGKDHMFEALRKLDQDD